MKDFLGQSIKPGDRVVYPGSVGRSMKKEMVEGTILAIQDIQRLRHKRYWADGRPTWRQEPVTERTVKIQQKQGSRSKRHEGAVVTIWNTENIVKVNISV